MFRNHDQSVSDLHDTSFDWQFVSGRHPGRENRRIECPPPTMNILSVAENPHGPHSMKEALLLNGYNVYAAENGIEARKILGATDIDLIIADLQMATYDGLTLRRFVRQSERYARTKFILISENAQKYANIYIRDPEVDFFIDETAPVSEKVAFVNQLMFGRYAGVWI